MSRWCHILTGFNQRYRLRFAALAFTAVVLVAAVFSIPGVQAAPSTQRTISFQGRLLNAAGNVVPDGHYNIQFKIYQGGSGSEANNPDGSLQWTESYINDNGTNGLSVRDGYFTVRLGSRTQFGSSIDWTQDILWLSMNVAGPATGCTTFGESPCVADGEMLPMKRLSNAPFAMNAGQLDGKTSSDFVQLAQGAQTDDSSESSIFINKTANGNFIQFQNNADDVFSINNAGDIILGSNANKVISVASTESAPGSSLSVLAGNGLAGGDLVLKAGDGSTSGGNISIDAGESAGESSGGTISIGSHNASNIVIGSTDYAVNQNISIGKNSNSGSTTNITIGADGSAAGGATTIQSKDDLTLKTNGTTRATFSSDGSVAYFGNGKNSALPTDFKIQATNSAQSGIAGGSLAIQGGNATIGDAKGGDLILTGGTGSVNGQVILGTATFSAATSDANCFTDGNAVSASCTISTDSIDNSSAVLVGFDQAGQTATLPDPTTKMTGRIIYVVAADNSETFTLSINGGGAGSEIDMSKNVATALMWNGSKWAVIGAPVSTTIQGFNIGQNVDKNIQLDNQKQQDPTLETSDEPGADLATTSPATNPPHGSLYYDTELGKLQCFEASGWGDCESNPDTFVSISPEYPNAVTNGDGKGELKSDFCSDTLNINNGHELQPEICGTNETYNFYQWTSSEEDEQTNSIYVTYKLPDNFKDFVSNSATLMGRTDSDDARIDYQIYKNRADQELVQCGDDIKEITGDKSKWQKASTENKSDPSNCDFKPGDSIIFKINLHAANNASAYVSNLDFVFSVK